ncbi:hypothetical protein OKA05_09400 [Luteolibacter arcticus]|uniref:Uncharacterized protein n=1 Tax=Luteolibacter arcticus TaxID=1581411 RepID=A0ABT3GGM7_9BACT|nr:hypothetical protein [Luteolibacter arcticus]MCW1922765.1 hypothetical protein [Luteolibacter arcticus]
MYSPRKPDAVSHAWFVAAMVLAAGAGAGYWWGSVRDDAAVADAERGVSTATKVRERPPEARAAGSATARGFVQSVIDGSLDVREHWRHIRSFTEEEVKAAVGDLEARPRPNMQSGDLAEMLFYRWGELDPVAANAAAKARDPKGFSWRRQAVIAAWIKQGGGVAAWKAVSRDGGIWNCTQTVQGEVAEMLVASLSDRDDKTAFKEVLRLDDENCEVAELLCRARAGKAAGSPESRAAFLAAADLHPRAYVRYYCARNTLAEEWAKVDAEAAEAASLIWEKEGKAAQEEEDAREEAEEATGDER